MVGSQVQDAHTGERFVVSAERAGQYTLRSIDNPGAPARFETVAGLEDYNLLPAPEPLGADSSEQRVLHARDVAANDRATRAYARRVLERER